MPSHHVTSRNATGDVAICAGGAALPRRDKRGVLLRAVRTVQRGIATCCHVTSRHVTLMVTLLFVQEALHYHGEISAGCCCVPSGRFSGRFCTNYRGFVPGTDLMLYSQIENYTPSSCWAEIKLKLVRPRPWNYSH